MLESLTPSDTPTQPPTAAELAEELGRVRYERDLLLNQVWNLDKAIGDRTGPTAWRTLLAIAAFVEQGGVATLNNGGPHV